MFPPSEGFLPMKRHSIATAMCPSPMHRCYDQRNQVVEGSAIEIVAHHGGYVGFKDQPNSTGVALLNHREQNLVNYIQESPDLARGNIKNCLVAAFERLDKDLKQMVIKSNCSPITLHAEELWMTRFNSLVVIVDKRLGQVHVAGSGQVYALLLKPGAMDVLTAESDYYNALAELGREKAYRPDDLTGDVVHKASLWIEDEHGELVPRTLPPVDKQLFYYKHVPLQREHNRVILASESYVYQDLSLRINTTVVSMVNLPEQFDTMGLDVITREVVKWCPHLLRIKLLLVLCLDHFHSGGDGAAGKRNATHLETATSQSNKQRKTDDERFNHGSERSWIDSFSS